MVNQNTVKWLRKVTSRVNFGLVYSSSHSSHFQNFSRTKVCQVSEAWHLWNNKYFWFTSSRYLVFIESYDPLYGIIVTNSIQPLKNYSGVLLDHRKCRIVESWNHFSWKNLLRLSSPTSNLTLPSSALNYVSKRHTCASFKYLEGWWLNYVPEKPVPMPNNPFGEEIFLISNLNLPWRNLRPFPLTLSLVTWEKRPKLTSLQPPFR